MRDNTGKVDGSLIDYEGLEKNLNFIPVTMTKHCMIFKVKESHNYISEVMD